MAGHGRAALGLLVALLAFTLAPAARAETLGLSRALRIARDRAPELKAARAQVASSEAQIDLARAGYLPTVAATATGSEAGSSEQAPIIPPRTIALTNVTYLTAATGAASLRWTFLDLGRTGNAVDSAKATRDASNGRVLDTEAQLASVVANAYLDVVYGEKARDLAKAIVDERERSVEIVKGLVKHGLAPAVDELRAHSRVEAARRDLDVADAQLVEARAGLLAFLGLDPRSAPSFTAPRLPRQRPDVEGAVTDSENRPSVVAARYDVASEEAGVDAARARYYPYLSLNGDASYRYARLDVYDQWLPTKSASASLVLTIPIYDPTNSPRLASAKADVDKASALYEQTRRDARTEAAKSAAVLSTNERVVDHARKAAESASAVLTVIRARWVSGLSSTLELIEAETSDAEARLAAVRAERSLDGATVRLYTATGRTGRLYDL